MQKPEKKEIILSIRVLFFRAIGSHFKQSSNETKNKLWRIECLNIISKMKMVFWKNNGYGYTQQKNEASVFTPSDFSNFNLDQCTLILINEDENYDHDEK